MAMFARKSMLEKNGIRIPTLDEPWTGTSSTTILVTLKESGEFEYPLNLGMADKGEWYPYAFLPVPVELRRRHRRPRRPTRPPRAR